MHFDTHCYKPLKYPLTLYCILSVPTEYVCIYIKGPPKVFKKAVKIKQHVYVNQMSKLYHFKLPTIAQKKVSILIKLLS